MALFSGPIRAACKPIFNRGILQGEIEIESSRQRMYAQWKLAVSFYELI
jgi:hypothetical protein